MFESAICWTWNLKQMLATEYCASMNKNNQQSQALMKQLLIGLFVSATMFTGTLLSAGDLERRQAKRIHDRITGVSPSNAVLDQMENLILTDSAEAAAYEAMNNPAFYNVTLKNFAAPWTNEAQTVFTPLNDYTATVIGMIRDDVDFRQVLWGDILYVGNVGGISGYANNNNDHYIELENLGPVLGDLSDPAILEQRVQSNVTGLPSAATAGVLTTRAATEAFFIGGTNRAMFRFTFMNHMCTDLEPIKDISRVPDRVHRDVSRSPGGDSRIYLNNCVGCHAGMDAMVGAFAYYEWNQTSNQLDYTPGTVANKYLINPNNFQYGHITTDDSWLNYWRNGQNKLLGWDPSVSLDENGHSTGNGAKSLGVELANSDAFSSCQVKKVFKTLCFRDSDDYAADRTVVQTITGDFRNNGYRMKDVFAKVAAYCKGP